MQSSNMGFSESRLRLMERLEHYYRIVSSIILSKQHPCTGLMPASVAVNSHGDYRDAWVRDNVYSILAVFGLALAYRRLDEDSGRAYELEHAVVKLMRGLLFAMMRQAEKVELFKNHQSTDNALHAKYSTATGGTVVGDKEWGHLQLDATSLFLLALAEMTTSGLQVIFTNDEVDFIQNLVFYIERAYRTPDYGIWERGNKINHGMPELNSSSIGMVVAAMQAINGVNLFGSKGGPSSVIHALPDEITRNYTTLHSALPRESNSKEIDSALLSVIGYPAFAVHDSKLLARTRSEIEKKLRGHWGCKRFLRDGHQTVLEDTRRLHYDSHELKVFEHIECEWPLFFVYFILEGLFNGDDEQVRFYRQALKPCLIDSSVAIQRERELVSVRPSNFAAETAAGSASSVTAAITPSPSASNYEKQIPKTNIPAGIPLVPELFIVPKHLVEAEKKVPNSQERIANENLPLVWAQSLYVLGELLHEGLLAPTEIDPLGRHLLPRQRSQKMDTIVQVVLIAEDEELQSRLSTFGIDTQTPEQVEPITILRPSALVEAYSVLGANAKLGLSGRPKRPIGTLGTSKIYRVEGRLYAFTPQFMDKEEFYMAIDNDYLVSVLQHELMFIKNHWWYSGRPALILYLTHNMMDGLLTSQSSRTLCPEDSLGLNANTPVGQFSFVSSRSKNAMLNMINSLKSGSCGEVRVRLGRMQELVSTSCIESLDFLSAKLEQGYLIRNDVHLNWKDILGRSFAKPRPLGAEYGPVHFLPSGSKSGQARVRRNVVPNKIFSPLLAPTAVAGTLAAMDNLELNPSAKAEDIKPSATPSKRERTKSQEIREFKLKSTPPNATESKLSSSPIVVLPRRSQGNRSASPARAGSQLVLDFGDPKKITAAVSMLSTSTSLAEQVELLEYLYSCVGLDYTVNLSENSKATVKELLEEVYQMSAKRKLWSVVRRAAGLLRKVVNSLTINLSGMLTRRKQVTIGIGKKEYTVSAPLGPSELEKIIFDSSTEDPREPSLIQEVLTYLGTYIRTQPSLFDGILRIRIHYIIIAMREEISRLRHCNEENALEFMMQLCPFEVKSLLGYVLSAHEQASARSCMSPADSDSKTISIDNSDGGLDAKSVNITVKSCGYHDGNIAEIRLNGQAIIEMGDRGLNVVVVNPLDGSIIANTYFDTHFSKEDSDDFATLIESLEPGTIVAIAAKDDAFEQLTEGAKLACESLGSACIRKLNYRDSWCLVGQKGNPQQETIECRKPSKSGSAEVLEKVINLNGTRIASKEPSLTSTDILPNGGAWLRRRKIDGALQRTPPGFYAKVYKILERSVSAISVGEAVLPRDPTVSETTPEEINFALHVESLLNALTDPAERQFAVDSLMVIYEMEQRNPEIRIGGGSAIVDLIKIIRQAYLLFWDHWLPVHGQRVFGVAPAAAVTPLRSVSSQSIESRDSSSIQSQQTQFSKDSSSVITPPIDPDWIKQHAFSHHEQLGRRMFFDLEQDGKHGSMSYLVRAIMQVMPYEIDLKTKLSAVLQKENEAATSCWTM